MAAQIGLTCWVLALILGMGRLVLGALAQYVLRPAREWVD